MANRSARTSSGIKFRFTRTSRGAPIRQRLTGTPGESGQRTPPASGTTARRTSRHAGRRSERDRGQGDRRRSEECLGTPVDAVVSGWINDIHSLRKEHDDPINLVTVLAHHHGLSGQDAIQAVATRIARRPQDHLSATRDLPAIMDQFALSPESRNAITRCVKNRSRAGDRAGGD